MINLEKFSIFLTISLIHSLTGKRNVVNRFSIFFHTNVQESIIGALSSEVIFIIIIITKTTIIIIIYCFQNPTVL